MPCRAVAVVVVVVVVAVLGFLPWASYSQRSEPGLTLVCLPNKEELQGASIADR